MAEHVPILLASGLVGVSNKRGKRAEIGYFGDTLGYRGAERKTSLLHLFLSYLLSVT
jgi:hypothetical protein